MRTSTAPLEPLPLDRGQSERLDQALSGLTPAQLNWVSGYAAGLAAAQAGRPAAAAPAAVAATGDVLTVLYGSQTGNGQAIAERLATKAREKGFVVSLGSLADYKPSQLKREKLLTFVVSTHGEGDPPDDAELFHEFLLSKKAPGLAGVRYSVRPPRQLVSTCRPSSSQHIRGGSPTFNCWSTVRTALTWLRPF